MAGEKTEKATPKRKQDERKKGNVFTSKDFTTAASLLAIFYATKNLMPYIVGVNQQNIRFFFNLAATQTSITPRDLTLFFLYGAYTFAVAAMPLLLISSLASVVVTMAQTRMMFSMKAMEFKMSRLSFLSGLKKLFSLRSLVELVKSLLKIIVLGYITWGIYMDVLPLLPNFMHVDPIKTMAYCGQVIMDIVTRVGVFFLFLSAGDYIYQWWEYEKNLRMSKQEIKDEYKQSEGDPQVKGKIKQMQQQRARQRMMQNVPNADVVIRNPTHYAVAVQYDKEKHRAPVVVAKGVDTLALRIVAVAEENGVYITEDVPLARALYAAVEIDQEIPEKFYQPIAKVLAFVYNLRKKDLK